MKKKVILIIAVFCIALIGYFAQNQKSREITVASFPKSLAGYELVDIQSSQKTDNASNAFLGIKEPIKKTFLANYKSDGTVVTLWTIVPEDPSVASLVAKEMLQNMTQQQSVFKNFQTIATADNTAAVTFTGPMDGMANYVYYKEDKVFWALIVTKNDASKAFDFFYKKI